jgi:hypothetical protein
MDECLVDDCHKKPFRRGYCSMHYSRLQRYGDLNAVHKPGIAPTIAPCSVDGCGNLAKSLGLCGKHYQRWRKYGDTSVTMIDWDRPVEERFWEKVNKNGPIPERKPELGPCWVWTGGTSEGYGMFWLNGTNIHAHIVSFTWAKGEIPKGWERDHLCRNRACVNPDHLEAVNHWTNVARGVSPHGQNAIKTHCPHDHEYTPENTYMYRGQRHCRECMRRRNREWWARQRSA